MRRVVHGVKLKHLNAAGHWPSGNVRFYYRPKGQKGVALPDLPPDHPDFLTAYARAAGNRVQIAPGSIAAGVVAFLASSMYQARSPATRANWRRAAEDIRQRYGVGRLVDLRPQHIRQDLAPRDPHPANNRLKVWRAMGRFWVDAGMIETDPARDVRKRETPDTGGRTAWTRDDVARFRAHWPIGSPQRLAFELLHRTCAAIGDACRLGPADIVDGWLTYQRAKSGSTAVVPMHTAPDWFEPCDTLARCIAAAAPTATFLATQSGAPRSPKAATQWFAAAARAAGVAATAHGIRKHRAAVFRENGATQDQRMAILGHESEAEARRYAKSADLRRVIGFPTGSN